MKMEILIFININIKIIIMEIKNYIDLCLLRIVEYNIIISLKIKAIIIINLVYFCLLLIKAIILDL